MDPFVLLSELAEALDLALKDIVVFFEVGVLVGHVGDVIPDLSQLLLQLQAASSPLLLSWLMAFLDLLISPHPLFAVSLGKALLILPILMPAPAQIENL